jgi:hypothetical protein
MNKLCWNFGASFANNWRVDLNALNNYINYNALEIFGQFPAYNIAYFLYAILFICIAE